MKMGTLELIHMLLKRRVKKMDEWAEAAAQSLERANGKLEETEESSNCGQAAVEEAQEMVERCKAEKERSCENLTAAKNALLDFESHDWH